MEDKDFTRPDKPAYFPSIFASPEEKLTKEYSLQVAKALFYNNFSVFQNAYGNTLRSRYIDNRNWSNGRFDINSFIGGAKGRNLKDKNPLLKHLDFDPITEQPKYRDIMVGYLEDLDFEITATSLNPAAQALKENEKLSELAILKMKQAGIDQMLNEAAGMDVAPKSQLPFEVTNQGELDMYYLLGGAKNIAELQIELANQIALNDSKWKELKKQLLEDAFDCGRMIVDIEYDKTGRVKAKYVDPVNCGVEDYRGHYLQRPSRIWYMELKTVQEILIDSNGQFTIQEAEQLAQMFENKFGNPVWNAAYQGWQTYVNTDSTYAYFFYNWKVPVMKLYWEELDYNKMATVDKYGKQFTSPAGFNDQSQTYYDHSKPGRPPMERAKTVEEYAVHNYYTAKWIVNTDFIYDYGKVPFQARDPYDIRFALCPMKYYRIADQPMAERVKAFCKKIYMTWQKIDNEVANKIPSGYKINVRALENISLGQGQTFTVKHSIELVNETGRMVYADEALADEMGRTSRKDPIEVFDTSTPFLRAIDAWIKLIQFYEDRIMKVTGINEFVDSTNPNPETPATAAKLAAQGAKHSFSQMASALLTIGEKMAIDFSERIRLIVSEQGEYSGYADAMGTGMIELAKITPEVVPHRFGIRIQAKPTGQERDMMKQQIWQSFSSVATPESGGLWVSAAIRFQQMVDAGVNMKLIRIIMEAEQRKALAMVQQNKQAAIQQQGEQNIQANQIAQKTELDVYGQKKQIDLQYEQQMTMEIIKREQAGNDNKTQNKIVADTHKSGLKIQEKQFDNT